MENLAARIILLWGWRRSLLALLAGAFGVLAQAPIDFFPAGFVSFTILVWLLDGATADDRDTFWRRQRVNFAIGWWFGFGYFVAGLWWVGQALLVDADEFAWALPLAVLGLPAGLAIFYGLATTVARLCWSNGIGRIAALAFAFGVAEWLRATALTGFPWNAIGYAAMPLPLLMQSVSVTGMYGMNALAVFVFAVPALLVSGRQRWVGLVAGLVLAAAHVGFGYYALGRTVPAGKSLSVRIVQPSIPQGGKWDPEYRDNILATLLELSARPPEEGRPRPELIVWPETALPFLFTDRTRSARSARCSRTARNSSWERCVRRAPARRFATTIRSSPSTTRARSSTRWTRSISSPSASTFRSRLCSIGLDCVPSPTMSEGSRQARSVGRSRSPTLSAPFPSYVTK